MDPNRKRFRTCFFFPIGHLPKNEVRQEAEKRGLYTYAKKDSQGLCFIGNIDVKDFLKKELGENIGNVLNEQGEVIGEHDGAIFFTLGERHGFTITKRIGDIDAYYVIKKDLDNNTIIVSTVPPISKKGHEISLEKVSFVSNQIEEGKYYARARYRAQLVKVELIKRGNTWNVISLEKGLSPVSGQSLVLYKDNYCIGGGIIV